MKKIIFTIAITFLAIFNVNAQYKKDGTPDMRYKANKNPYSTSSYSTGTSSSTRYQQGYIKNNGTYVKSHFKTNINSTNHDNFSTSTNTNVYTGSQGSRAKDYSQEAYNYGKGKAVTVGEKGGQYYENDKGNKVYVPKRF